MRRLVHGAVAFAAVAAFGVIAASAAFAHEVRQAGAYSFTVGWEHEPTYVGTENAVQLFIHDAHGKPVDDIGTPPTLHVAVIFGGVTSPPLSLEPSFDPDTGLGTHGEFDAAIIPTAVGNYTFHFYGSLNGQKIDQRFTSGPSTFDTVQDPSSIGFPNQVPGLPTVAQLGSQLTARVNTTKSTASSAHTLGLLGVILGAVGIIVGVGLGGGGLLLARRRVREASKVAS